MIKKLIATAAIVTSLGLAPFVAVSAFAETTAAPVQHYNQAVAQWQWVTGAKCYNIYYGNVSRKNKPVWNHSVRCVPKNMWQYTIKGLKQDASYEYTVAAVGYSGREFSWSPIAPLVTTPQM